MLRLSLLTVFFFFNDTATTEIYTLSLHDALPISIPHTSVVSHNAHARRFHEGVPSRARPSNHLATGQPARSEEHTSELQSPCNLVCRLLLEKKNNHQPDPLVAHVITLRLSAVVRC